jgi:hypothetical protein
LTRFFEKENEDVAPLFPESHNDDNHIQIRIPLPETRHEAVAQSQVWYWTRTKDAAAVISSLTIAERGSEIDPCGCDVLLIAVLSVEAENIFDGPKVAGFVVVGSGILNVVEAELVLTGGCDSCVGIGAAPLEALLTVTKISV